MNSLHAAALAESAFDMDQRGDPEWRRQVRFVAVALGLALMVFLGWAMLAPISGAVVAPAQVKVEYQRKTVQHQEGGIVRAILVRNGQRVTAGQPLIEVGDARTESTARLLRDQLLTTRLRIARTQAEVALEQDFAPADVTSASGETAVLLRRERVLFEARRRALDDQIGTLQRQRQDAVAQERALTAQLAAAQTSAQLARDELDIHQRLVREGFVHRAKYLELQRAASDYAGRVGQQQSEHAAVRRQLNELEERMHEARNRYRQTAAQELKDATASMQELQERLQPSVDQLTRQWVRAPVDGEVMNLRIGAIGEVLAPRQAILEVVPSREKLVIEARIAPDDIAHIQRGAAVDVRLSAFDARQHGLLPGKVTEVSADRLADADGKNSWFTVTVEVEARTLGKQHDLALRPGMPAEVFITTADRTLLEYLLKPLFLFNQRAMRET